MIETYRRMPGTLGYIRRADRRLAATLHDRGVALQIVEDAILLATARRVFRSADATPLAPIASLHYLLPVIHELAVAPPDPSTSLSQAQARSAAPASR
jgi:hypothetical protein